MNLTIIYKSIGELGSRDSLRLENVESIRLIKEDIIETKTFGNEPVIQRNVWEFTAEYKSGIAE